MRYRSIILPLILSVWLAMPAGCSLFPSSETTTTTTTCTPSEKRQQDNEDRWQRLFVWAGGCGFVLIAAGVVLGIVTKTPLYAVGGAGGGGAIIGAAMFAGATLPYVKVASIVLGILLLAAGIWLIYRIVKLGPVAAFKRGGIGQ